MIILEAVHKRTAFLVKLYFEKFKNVFRIDISTNPAF